MQIFLDNFDAVSAYSGDLGKSPLLKFKIKIKDGAEPVRTRLRPLNPDQTKDLERQLDEWIKADVIEPSESDWAAALVPVRTKLPLGESAADEPSRPFTTFVTPRGLYQFKQMPFGLTNSPAIFCRLVQMALDRPPPNIALGYLDDILVIGNSIEKHGKSTCSCRIT